MQRHDLINRARVWLPRFWMLAGFTLVTSGCSKISFDQPKNPSYAMSEVSGTAIARDVARWSAAHEGLSGFYPLFSGLDAFGARLALMEKAESSIDAQYFLMKPDDAGLIFAGALLQAADRGVRVRLLLDDVFTTANDSGLAALDQHPNIAVRLYNPIARRGFFYLNFLGDFKRANRRLHLKSFTVDHQITIIGGRNIANEYFDLHRDGEFLDLDVVGVGPVAADVAGVFDSFWNHSHSIPLDAVVGSMNSETVHAARSAIEAGFSGKQKSMYAAAVRSPLLRDLFNGIAPLHPATAEVITDDPEKLVNQIDPSRQTLVNHLATIAVEAESEIIVITPYFVPQEAGVAFWSRLVERGIRVVIVTNSLASTNHIAVHSGYAKYRRPVLHAGAELYELRANAISQSSDRERATRSSATLHTKAIIIDRKILFAGSLNLDPRSIDINAEMGAVIRSSDLAGELANLVMEELPELTYRVELDADGDLLWRGTSDGVEITETSEPLAGRWRRFKAFLLKIVPDEQL